MRFNLSVSGTASGSKTLVIRTTDRDGDGRVESTEGSPGCDLNYDGIVNSQDSLIAAPHVTDWKRNALHGTLVKRTNLCDTCAAGQANTMGSGDLSWSPSGRRIVFSIRDEQRNCKIFHAAADPSGGNVPQEFTWPATPD